MRDARARLSALGAKRGAAIFDEANVNHIWVAVRTAAVTAEGVRRPQFADV